MGLSRQLYTLNYPPPLEFYKSYLMNKICLTPAYTQDSDIQQLKKPQIDVGTLILNLDDTSQAMINLGPFTVNFFHWFYLTFSLLTSPVCPVHIFSKGWHFHNTHFLFFLLILEKSYKCHDLSYKLFHLKFSTICDKAQTFFVWNISFIISKT